MEAQKQLQVSNKNRVWNAKLVEDITNKVVNGEPIHGGTPFHEGDIDYRAADVVYEYTDEELKEIAKCATDIVYFANNYCVSMTDEGIQKIKLRNYQERVLKQYQKNRWIVFLASRQIGKCLSRQTKIKILQKNGLVPVVIPIYILYFMLNKPKTILEHFKLFLYKLDTLLTEGKIYNRKTLKQILNATNGETTVTETKTRQM